MSGDFAAVLLGCAALGVWILHTVRSRQRKKQYRERLRNAFSEEDR